MNLSDIPIKDLEAELSRRNKVDVEALEVKMYLHGDEDDAEEVLGELKEEHPNIDYDVMENIRDSLLNVTYELECLFKFNADGTVKTVTYK